MNETIHQITAEFADHLAAWLDQPDEASRGLQELRERLQALGATIGTSAKNEALRALSGSEKSVLATRQRAAADAIAAACRIHGVILEPKAPLKRPTRKHSKPSVAPKVAEQARPASTEHHRSQSSGGAE